MVKAFLALVLVAALGPDRPAGLPAGEDVVLDGCYLEVRPDGTIAARQPVVYLGMIGVRDKRAVVLAPDLAARLRPLAARAAGPVEDSLWVFGLPRTEGFLALLELDGKMSGGEDHPELREARIGKEVRARALVIRGTVVDEILAGGSPVGLERGDIIVDYGSAYDIVMGGTEFGSPAGMLGTAARSGGRLRVIRGDRVVSVEVPKR
jgi:hypothetical protein